MQGLSDQEATLECDPSQYRATRITLRDKESGAIAVVETCWRFDVPVCENLHNLAETYTPNDWDAECEA